MKGIRNDKTRLVSLSFAPWNAKRTFLPKWPNCFIHFIIPVLIGLCSYKNVLVNWGHSRWKFTFTQIVSLRAFLLFWPPFRILKRVPAVHLFPDSRSRFPVPRSPFPVPGISNIHLENSRQVKILKKTTTLLNLQDMFRQKLLSSSVDRFTKRQKLNL